MNHASSPKGNATERSQSLCFVRVIGFPSGHNLEPAGFNASVRLVTVGEGLTLVDDFSRALIQVARGFLQHTATNLY